MLGLLVAMTALIGTETIFDIELPWYLPQVALYSAAIYGAVLRHRQGDRPATFLCAGWTLLTIGYVINAFAYQYYMATFWRYSLYLTFAFESMMFAVAVGYKARLSELKAHFENMHAFRQMEKVFYPHQINQIRHGIELEQTMPTGSGEACVICFDIVGSSKINHEKTKDFLRNIFRRCNEAMDTGYDAQNLVASGFRIKEMGDGFICSVGYPFKSPTGSMARDALRLALSFNEIFDQEVRSFAYPEPLHCCVALAMDTISGFYPAGGTKSYDLFGRAIVLATRYEAMRKVMFADGLKSSVLITQERVYLSLDPRDRSTLTKYSLRDNNVSVRDDSAAEFVYYRKLPASAVYADEVIELPRSA
jgi:class 3 adenylate cyclase